MALEVWSGSKMCRVLSVVQRRAFHTHLTGLLALCLCTSTVSVASAQTQLPVGTHRLAFELSGFQTLIRERVQVPAGFHTTVNVQLKIGAVEETITVSVHRAPARKIEADPHHPQHILTAHGDGYYFRG